MFLLTAQAAVAGSGMYANTGPITTVHLIVIALLVALTIAAILWGIRQKRARNAADAVQQERNDALLAHPATGADAAAPAPAEPAPTEAPPAPSEPAPTPAGRAPYRLVDVKGLGAKAVPLLDAQGVSDLAGLAALSPERAAQIDASLGALAGRMARDRWIEQAKLLAAGDVAGFEATYGKL